MDVKTEDELQKYFEIGNNYRHVAETAMNRINIVHIQYLQ